MDFTSDLPPSEQNETILVVVDRLTKMATFILCRGSRPNAPHTARLIFDNIFRFYGLPIDIVSDRDSIFTSDFWHRLTELLNIKLCISPQLIIRKQMVRLSVSTQFWNSIAEPI